MKNYDNPNGQFIPGQYNPNQQVYSEGDLAAMYGIQGIQDPTQVPRYPGDTERPMHKPDPPDPITVEAIRQLFQSQQQPQRQPDPITSITVEEIRQLVQSQLQQKPQQAVPLPRVQASPQAVQPTVIPVVLELTINLKLNIQAQEA